MDYIGRFSTTSAHVSYYVDNGRIGYMINEKEGKTEIFDEFDNKKYLGFLYKYRTLGNRLLFSINVVGLDILSISLGVYEKFFSNSLFLSDRRSGLRCLLSIKGDSDTYIYGNNMFILSSDNDDHSVYMEIPPELGFMLSRLSSERCYEFLRPLLEHEQLRGINSYSMSGAGGLNSFDLRFSSLVM